MVKIQVQPDGQFNLTEQNLIDEGYTPEYARDFPLTKENQALTNVELDPDQLVKDGYDPLFAKYHPAVRAYREANGYPSAESMRKASELVYMGGVLVTKAEASDVKANRRAGVHGNNK